LLLQLIDASLQLAPLTRFKAAISKLTSCSLLVGISWISLLGDATIVTTILTSLQMASILALMATIASIKRRPVVFRPDGKIVDQQMTVSLWSRYSFQWGVDTLSAAGKEKFENSDIPAMDHHVRSQNATERFNNIVIKDSTPLWVQIFWAFRAQLILQWLSILLSNFFDVAPAFATLQLLRYLETRTDPNAIEPGAWKYVVGIAVASISSHMIDSRIIWWVVAGTFNCQGLHAYTKVLWHRHSSSASIHSYRAHVRQNVEDQRLRRAPRRRKLLFDLVICSKLHAVSDDIIINHDRKEDFFHDDGKVAQADKTTRVHRKQKMPRPMRQRSQTENNEQHPNKTSLTCSQSTAIQSPSSGCRILSMSILQESL
jgi:hypothetical protein